MIRLCRSQCFSVQNSGLDLRTLLRGSLETLKGLDLMLNDLEQMEMSALLSTKGLSLKAHLPSLLHHIYRRLIPRSTGGSLDSMMVRIDTS